jgi:hypothetical protein
MVETFRETVALGEAESVQALMQMGSGKLVLKGGAEDLLEGSFEVSDPVWRPEVTYEVSSGHGNLVVKQPDRLGSWGALNPANAWDVKLGDRAPLELAIRLGSGDADLRLDATRAILLDAVVGSGQVQADVSGAGDLRHVSVKAGSGRVGLLFDGEYARLMKVEVNVASGMTDLDLKGAYPALQDLRINSASGHIALRIAGACPVLKTLVINTASGVVDLDLDGDLPEDLVVSVRCVSGAATVKVPDDRGVSVRFSSLSGKLKAPGFRKENGWYVKGVHREGAAVLQMAMSTVSGELSLQPSGS